MLSRVAQTLIVLFMVSFTFACDGTLEASYEETAQSASEESQEEAYENDDAADPTEELVDEKADSFEPSPAEEPEPEPEPEETELEEPEETEPTRPEPGTVVEFTIQDGTGSSAWNSRDNPVEVYVGQFLVVYNEDSRAHRIHAPDDGPFPHGRDIPPGGFASYEVMSSLEVGDNPTLYDHNDGPGAAFWIRAIE